MSFAAITGAFFIWNLLKNPYQVFLWTITLECFVKNLCRLP